MDDVFIEGANVNNNDAQEMLIPAQSRLRLKAYCIGSYFLNLFVKAFLMFLLLSLNFSLFVKAGTFDVFSESALVPEIAGVLWKFFYISLGVMFILSFSYLLQNTALSVVAAVFVWALLNQFALFDVHNFLSDTIKLYISDSWGNLISGYSHIAAAVLVFVLVFVYLIFAHYSNLLVLSGVLALINVYILVGDYWKGVPQNDFWESSNSQPLVNNKGNKKFVHILLPNAASYPYVADLSEKLSDNKSIGDLKQLMLAFAVKNNFEIFPNAYVTDDDEKENLAYLMNLGDKSEDGIIQVPLSNRSWDFSRLSRHLPQLRENKLAYVFDKGVYNISAYQSENINLCTYHHDNNSQRCTSKISMPVMLDNVKNVDEKQKFILSQWLESTGFLAQNDDVSKTLKAMLEKADLIAPSFGKLYVVNSLNVLDNLTQDILKDKGNTYYLVALDLPADVFVYNQFCMLKPQSQWINMHGKDDKSEKYAAYAEQYSCLLGRLQKFIDDLNGTAQTKQNVVVLQGISPISDDNRAANTSVVTRFFSQQNVWLAIRDSAVNKFEVNSKICSGATLLSDYLYHREKCVPFADLYYTASAQKILQSLNQFKLSESDISQSQNFYELWYKYWRKAQEKETSAQNLLKNIQKEVNAEKNMQTKKNASGKETVENVTVVSPAPKVADVIQEEKEENVKPLFQSEKEAIQKQNTDEKKLLDNNKIVKGNSAKLKSDVENKASDSNKNPEVRVKVNVQTNVSREMVK